MHQAVNFPIQPDEDTEIGNGLDSTLDQITLVTGCTEFIPWIRETLLDTQ